MLEIVFSLFILEKTAWRLQLSDKDLTCSSFSGVWKSRFVWHKCTKCNFYC